LGFELQEAGRILQHEDLASTPEVGGDLSMKATRRIQPLVVNFVEQLGPPAFNRHLQPLGNLACPCPLHTVEFWLGVESP
jgi:hypothetical protein